MKLVVSSNFLNLNTVLISSFKLHIYIFFLKIRLMPLTNYIFRDLLKIWLILETYVVTFYTF